MLDLVLPIILILIAGFVGWWAFFDRGRAS